MAITKDPVRVAVTGAAGQIGYSLLFRICLLYTSDAADE